MSNVVLLSGGIDSAATLTLAQDKGVPVSAVTIDYGQRHSIELHFAQELCNFYNVKDHLIIKVPIGTFGGSTLTDPACKPRNTGIRAGLADTYVPARNSVLLAIAASFAESRGAKGLWIGANKSDFEGYPDCRQEYFDAYQNVLNLGMAHAPKIHRPLIGFDKSDVLRLAIKKGVPLHLTWSCYDPIDGVHCGMCDACRSRNQAFATASIPDPTIYHPR